MQNEAGARGKPIIIRGNGHTHGVIVGGVSIVGQGKMYLEWGDVLEIWSICPGYSYLLDTPAELITLFFLEEHS